MWIFLSSLVHTDNWDSLKLRMRGIFWPRQLRRSWLYRRVYPPLSANFRCSRGFIVHSVQSGPSRDLFGTITTSTAAVAADGRAQLDEAHELCRRLWDFFMFGERTWVTQSGREEWSCFFSGVAEIEFLKRVSTQAAGGRIFSPLSSMELGCRSNTCKGGSSVTNLVTGHYAVLQHLHLCGDGCYCC